MLRRAARPSVGVHADLRRDRPGYGSVDLPVPWIGFYNCGWFVVEYGRTWTIYGCCRRICRSGPGQLYGTGFVGFYTVLLIVEMYLMKFAKQGPGSLGTTPDASETEHHVRLRNPENHLVAAGRRAARRLRHHGRPRHGRRHAAALRRQNDTERRVIINTVGPHWDGNQVWFITGGGAIFAAWPLVYATAFSGFYWAMLAVLWALFFRPVGFDYRSKIHNATWRDLGLGPVRRRRRAAADLRRGLRQPVAGRALPLRRIPGVVLHRLVLGLLNPFALLCGVVSTAMITFHGAIYLAHRTEGVIQRARSPPRRSSVSCWSRLLGAGVWLYLGIDGYVITSAVDGGALPIRSPRRSAAKPAPGWPTTRAHRRPSRCRSLAYAGRAGGIARAKGKRTLTAFVASALCLTGVIGTAGASMFPFVMPSSSDLNASLTVWDSVSSHLTLSIMFWATLIFMPLIVFYTSWAYSVMAGKVTAGYVHDCGCKH
jgi:cytochrome d ubiquinol oxidase subunit II